MTGTTGPSRTGGRSRTTGAGGTSGVAVMAVADSDSYLKWAAATVASLRPEADGTDVDVVVVRSPIAPTPAQAASAVAGTALPVPPVLGLRALRRTLRQRRPDVLLVATTGPMAEVVARLAVRTLGADRPALVTGLPGMALPATRHGTGWRRWCDAFVVHGRRERPAYAQAFGAHEVAPDIVLSHLPFLDGPLPDGPQEGGTSGTVAAPDADRPRRLVFAAQPSVPAARPERVALLGHLAGLAGQGYEVVVKLRARAGERQTHDEEHPYDALWSQEAASLGHPADALTFATGPMAEWLTPGTALATVSSTAALESLGRGLPTLLVADLGVRPDLLNEPFAASGCLVALRDAHDVLRAGGPVPDPAWLEENYLHAEPSELPDAVARLARRRADRELAPLRDVVPWSAPRYAWSWLRAVAPRWAAGIPASLRRRRPA